MKVVDPETRVEYELVLEYNRDLDFVRTKAGRVILVNGTTNAVLISEEDNEAKFWATAAATSSPFGSVRVLPTTRAPSRLSVSTPSFARTLATSGGR